IGSLAVGVSAAHAQGTALPDLLLDGARVQTSLFFQVKNFSRNDCAVQEGLLTGIGKRALMRVDVSTANIGRTDLVLGNPALHPELFTWSPCHKHYHFKGYASYELLNAAGTALITGRKEAFCLEDFEIYSRNAGSPTYTCSYQGISVGWADTYGS